MLRSAMRTHSSAERMSADAQLPAKRTRTRRSTVCGDIRAREARRDGPAHGMNLRPIEWAASGATTNSGPCGGSVGDGLQD